jgi:hypothetical protein
MKAFGFITGVSLMLLCSCATQNSIYPSLPAETALNPEAVINGAGEGNRILSENVHNSLNCPIIVHCKRHIFHHLRIKRHGDDQTLMQIDASANVISRPCALVRSYHNPANLRVKTEILSAHRKGRGA